jgi:hypothetical protein
MKDFEEKIQLSITDGGGEVVIRHGEALPMVKPIPIKIVGQIHAPAEYLAKRGKYLNRENTHLLIDEQNARIELVLLDNTELKGNVVGKMMVNPEYEAFRINKAEWDSPKELGEFLRKNRAYFTDREKMSELIMSLLNFKAKVEKELERSDDKRGNKRDLVEQRISTDVPSTFMLTMPLHKGGEPSKFEVELFFDVRDAGCKLSLQSIEAQEILRAEVQEAILQQLPAFEDYVTIHV